MKHFILKSIAICLICCLLHSCFTSQTVTITGTPNTGIYNLAEELMTTIPASGQVKLEISDDDCYPLLLSKASGSDQFVPFALNYKKDDHILNGIANVASYEFALIGAVTTVVGLVASNNGEEFGGPLAGYGLLGVGTGAYMGLVASSRANQVAYEYGYKYLSKQDCNSDIQFTVPNIQYVENAFSKRTSRQTPSTLSKQTTKKVRPGNDLAKKVQGSYIGSGKMQLDNKEFESLSGIKIVIEQLSANEVSVEVIEADGNNFFDESFRCIVEKDQSGSYSLKCSNNNDISVSIKSNGLIFFKHNNINIEDSVYTLTITGKKAK